MIGPEWNSVPVPTDPYADTMMLLAYAATAMATGWPASRLFDWLKNFVPWPRTPNEYLASPRWRKWLWYWLRGIETYGETFYIRKFAPKTAQAVLSIVLGTAANAVLALVVAGEYSIWVVLSGGLTYLVSQFVHDYPKQAKAQLAAPGGEADYE
jgi:hypothetical protein